MFFNNSQNPEPSLCLTHSAERSSDCRLFIGIDKVSIKKIPAFNNVCTAALMEENVTVLHDLQAGSELFLEAVSYFFPPTRAFKHAECTQQLTDFPLSKLMLLLTSQLLPVYKNAQTFSSLCSVSSGSP